MKMRILIQGIPIILFLTFSSCVYSQSHEKQVEDMLLQFYTAHQKVWEKKNPSTVLNELDSLYQVYCTTNLSLELNKLFQEQGLDHDIFTNDYGMDEESLETLAIAKDSSRDHAYLVSYSVNSEDPSNKPLKIEVIIHLSVTKENGNFKISEVR
jgi:hypothetical protein